MTAAATGAALRDGRLDPVELVQSCLARIAAADPAIFTVTLPERALAEARAARERLRAGLALGPLDGVPVAWKDLFDLSGRVTTAGSAVLRGDAPASADAALVAAAARAGMVTLGCLNMTEFAYSGIGLNPHYGTPGNARDRARVPGGSSSGCGVAVALGLVPLAIGSDTSGSIRIPAAFNGITGYKPSSGRYPMAGVFPLSPTLDVLGPLARDVGDCALVDAVLTGHAPAPPTPPEALDIAVPRQVLLDDAEPAVLANFQASLQRLEAAGARLRRIDLPELAEVQALFARHGALVAPEALLLHRARINGPEAALMDRRVVRRLRQAEGISALDLLQLQNGRRRLSAAVAEKLGAALLACPTTPTVAMPIAPLEADDDAFFRANALTLRNTMLGSFLGWCGISIPNGSGEGDMPTGLLLSATGGRDRALLSAAMTAESILRAAP